MGQEPERGGQSGPGGKRARKRQMQAEEWSVLRGKESQCPSAPGVLRRKEVAAQPKSPGRVQPQQSGRTERERGPHRRKMRTEEGSRSPSMGNCCAGRHQDAREDEDMDPTGSVRVTCLSRLPTGLHFRRLRVTKGYPGRA